MPHVLRLAVALLLVAGCTPTRGTTVFDCGTNRWLVVQWDRQRVVVDDGTGPVALPRRLSDTGYAYGDGSDLLRGQGQKRTTWKTGNRPVLACERD